MRRAFLLLGVVLLAAYLLTGVAQVRPGERAVVRRFGAVVAQPGPGLWIGLPWGFDRIDKVPVNFVRRVAVGYRPDDDSDPAMPAGQLLTGDHNLVNIQVLVDYDVRDDALADYVMQQDRIDGLVTRAAEAALAEWVAAHPVDEVLLTGKALVPTWLAERVQARLAPYRLGIAVQGANVAYLLPPDEVRSAFDEVTRAQAAIHTRENEARQEAQRSLAAARADQVRLAAQASAYRDERLKLAKADAEGFLRRLEQYQRLRQTNPDVLTAIWWDETGKLLTRLRDNGRVDLLDNRIGPDGLEITQFGPRPRKR